MPSLPRKPPHSALALLLACTGCFSPVGSIDAGTSTAPGTTTAPGTSTTPDTTDADPTETSPASTTDTSDGTSTSTSTTGNTSTTTDTIDTSTATTESEQPLCGDGKLDPNETCDDGRENGADRPCTPECKPNLCGDGHHCPSCIVREECDDGNVTPGDSCSPICQVDGHLIFVTPTTFPANMTVEQADIVCKDLAAQHFVPTRNFVAWLSTVNAPTANRIGQTLEPYRLPGGELLANNTVALLATGVAREIDQDPSGKTLKGEATCMEANLVWTGSKLEGTTSNEQHCDNWTNALGGLGLAGSFKGTGAAWTDLCPMTCTMSLRLYCIQIG